MGDGQRFIRLHGQTRARTIGLTLGGLAFALVIRIAAGVSAAPDPLPPAISWGLWALVAVCFVGFLRGIWHAFAPRVEITLTPYPLVVGRVVRVEWDFATHSGRVRDLRIEAHFLGARFDRRGHKLDTPSRLPLVNVGEGLAARGSLEVELPPDLVPTSRMRKHETGGKWSIEVRARVDGAPGVFESYPVRVERR